MRLNKASSVPSGSVVRDDRSNKKDGDLRGPVSDMVKSVSEGDSVKVVDDPALTGERSITVHDRYAPPDP